MRKVTAIAATALTAGLAIASAAWSASPKGTFNAATDVAAIRALEEKLQTETDMTKLIGLYAPNAIVLDIYAPGIFKGRKQIMEGFAPQLAMIKTMKHEFRDFNVATNGKLACAAMQIHFDTQLQDGKSLSMTVRALDAFRKINGKWQIIQQHVSLPVDAKTGMAVIDGAVTSRGAFIWSADPLPGPATTPAQAKQEIRRWMDVGGVSTGLDQLMQYYGPGDDTLVYDNFYPGNLRGRKEIRDNYAAIMGNIKSSQLTMPEFAVDSDGNFGVQIDTQDIKLTLKDGTTSNISLRQSDCMRRVEGKWYSFFEMISFPVDARSGKAIMETTATTAR